MIKSEIKELIRDLQIDETSGEISAKFAFPDSFTGFSGHFPGNPILPGVCQIQCVLSVISGYYKQTVNLNSITRAKFLNIVEPNQEITVKGTCEKSGNKISGKFKITKQSEGEVVNISRISMNVEFF